VQGRESIFPKTLDIILVDSTEQAEFFVVDDTIRPTDVEYSEILQKARKQQVPILTRSDVERAHDYTLMPPKQEIEDPVQFENVQEDDDGHRLTFDKNSVESLAKRKDATEILEHEILLRDPIVRWFVLSDEAYKEWNSTRDPMFDDNPRRVVGTRWKIDDVLTNYVSEAWQFLDASTCVWQWDEDKFNRDYATPSDLFKPTDVVRAALFEFFDDNDEIIEELLPLHIESDTKPTPMDIYSTAGVFGSEPQPEPPKFTCKYSGCGKSFELRLSLDRHEKAHPGGDLDDAFGCPLCSESFPLKSELFIHQSSVHQKP